MANSDGQVRIDIITNAKEAVRELDKVSSSFKENAKDANKLSDIYNQLEKEAQEYTAKLRVMALGGDKNSKEFQRLAQHVRDLKTTLNDANKVVDKATGGFDAQANGMNKLAGFAKSLIATYISFAGAARAAQFAMQSVQAFREQERAVASLNNALMNAGAYSYQYSQQIQALASEIQSYSNYGDEAIIKAQALGQAYVGSTRITEQLTKATVDFAAATGMDLEQAFALVGKSVGSQTNALARYGIQLQKGMSDTQKMDAITKQLSDRYAGQAKVMSDGTIQLKNAIGDLSESIGRTLDPSVNTATNLFMKWANSAKVLLDRLYAVRLETSKLTITQAQDKLAYLYQEEQRAKTYNPLAQIDFTDPYPIIGAAKRIYKTATIGNQGRLKEVQAEIKAVEDHVQSLVKNEAKLEQISKSRGYKLTDDFGISSVGGGSSSVEKAKDQYEKLQEAAAKAKREIELAAIAHGTSSVEVQNAFTNYKALNEQLQSISALFGTEKGSYQQLVDKVSELTLKLRDLAAEKKIGTAEWELYNNELKTSQEELKAVNQALENNGIKVEEMSKSLSSTLSSGLISALRNGGNAFEVFGNIATNVLQRVLDKLLEMTIITPLLDKLTGGVGGSFFSGIFKFLGFKDGAVFQNGNVIPFARGGIVNKPTIFPMANGGTGLMGEAGAEAVMPLRRMSNGRLGVEADTSKNGQVVNIYNYSGANVETRKRDDNTMDVFIRKVNEALTNERTSSGFRSAYAREDSRGVQAV